MQRPTLATTKIQPPRARSARVARPALEAALRDALGHKRLVLLVAPAGFGKTSALAGQIAALPDGTALAWLSLDEDDDDQRFVACLCAALEPFDLPWRTAPAALAGQLIDDEDGAGLRATVAELVNALAASEAAHGVIVFAAILGRVGQAGCRVHIGRVIRPSTCRAREHSRTDIAAAHPHECLGAGPHEPGVREREGVRVGGGQPSQPAALVGDPADVGDEVASEHNLAELAGTDVLPRGQHGGLVLLGCHRARHERGRAGRPRRARFDRKAALEPRDPGHVAAPADDHARNGQHARRCRRIAEREAAKGGETRTGQVDLVVHLGRVTQVAPPAGQIGDAIRALVPERCPLTEADDSLAAAEEGQRMLRFGPVEKGTVVVESFGAHPQHLVFHTPQRSRRLRTLRVRRIREPRLDSWPRRI